VIFAILLSSLVVFWPSLKLGIALAVRDDRYLQTVLAPMLVPVLLFWRRAEIFAQARYSPGFGMPLLCFALVSGFAAARHQPDNGNTGLLIAAVGIVTVWFAAFLLCYGVRGFRAGFYPLCCLLLTIPPPPSWMDGINTAFQHGSATVSHWILWLSGLPVLRHGMQLSLPGLTFEVAPECSGIRSSLAFILMAIVTGYVYLRSGWGRLTLVLVTIPIVLFKNALRIVAITTLGTYVNPAFISGPFHRYGGLIFSVAGVALFVSALALIHRIENRQKKGSPTPDKHRTAWKMRSPVEADR
jgi:exosortase